MKSGSTSHSTPAHCVVSQAARLPDSTGTYHAAPGTPGTAPRLPSARASLRDRIQHRIQHRIDRAHLALCALALLGLASSNLAQAQNARVTAYEYDARGNLIKEIIQPEGSPGECLVNVYDHDLRGNRESSIQRPCGPAEGRAALPASDPLSFAPRTTTVLYGDAYKRLPTRITNAEGHIEDRAYDYRFGALTQQTETSNGASLYTSAQYDGFGRPRLVTRKDRTRDYTDYVLLSTGRFAVRTLPQDINGIQDGPRRVSFHDGLGREVATETQGMDGRLIYTSTEYDEAGRLKSQTRPYYAGQPEQRSAAQYDPLDRLTDETTLDGKRFTHTYAGLVEVIIDAKGKPTTMRRNHLGQLIQVADALGSQLTYRYNKHGDLYNTIDAKGNSVQVGYDDLGRRKRLNDPDMGEWSYSYNALGELVTQRDQRNNLSTLKYDRLGRLTERREADLIASWQYDRKLDGSLCGPSIGRLCEARADNGYLRSHSYDGYGRNTSTTTLVAGQSLTTTDGYDPQHGRVSSQTYPSGLQIVYGYNSFGYLTQVGNSSGTNYWTALERDAEQHLRQQRFGNNTLTEQIYDSYGRIKQILVGAGGGVQNLAYQYESGTGNLLVREDRNQALIESLAYDALNRLNLSTVNASAVTPAKTTRFGYDAIGNMVCKSDLGECSESSPNLFYNALSADGRRLPHAVAVVGGTVHGMNNPGYNYDANGNFIAGAGRMASWKSFNMPFVLERPGTYRTEFLYGPEHQRVKQIAVGGGVTRTLHYLHPDQANGLLYELEQFGATTTHNHYINAGGENIALVKLENGAWSTQYMHRDNLGSVATITDQAGNVSERLAYDAWGKRRFAQGTADTGDTIHASAATRYITDRGYTNHEMLDELGMIHMNGRIYDPVIARFQSPDPNVTNPKWMQSFNRYSYVLNNPFAYTDPTGFDDEDNPGGLDYSPDKDRSEEAKKEDSKTNKDIADKFLEDKKTEQASNRANMSFLDRAIEFFKDSTDPFSYLSHPERELMISFWEKMNPDVIGKGGYVSDEVVSRNIFQKDKDHPNWAVFSRDVATQISSETYSFQVAMGFVGVGRLGQIHHIASNKNIVSGFTAKFEAIFSKAGMRLSAAENKVYLLEHRGRHSPLYHQYVLDRLSNAVHGFRGAEYREALKLELNAIKSELEKSPGLLKGEGLR